VTRSEFVQRLVLNEICDDFENVDQVILRNVNETAAKCGLKIERKEVVEALARLVEYALAKAYDLSNLKDAPGSGELQGMPCIDETEEYFRTYFYCTKKGKDLQLSDHSWWPFDDDENLQPDWRLT
jgi:hypothetical protein